MRRAARVDANQGEIVEVLRAMGGDVAFVFQLKNHCDIDLYYRGVTVKVEIKMPGEKLTPGEEDFRQKVEGQGCKYAVLESVEQAELLMKEIYQRTKNWKGVKS